MLIKDNNNPTVIFIARFPLFIFRALCDVVEDDCDTADEEEKMSSLQLYAKLKELDLSLIHI